MVYAFSLCGCLGRRYCRHVRWQKPGTSQNGSGNQSRQDLGGRYRLCRWRCVHSRGERRIVAATFGTLAMYRAWVSVFLSQPS